MNLGLRTVLGLVASLFAITACTGPVDDSVDPTENVGETAQAGTGAGLGGPVGPISTVMAPSPPPPATFTCDPPKVVVDGKCEEWHQPPPPWWGGGYYIVYNPCGWFTPVQHCNIYGQCWCSAS